MRKLQSKDLRPPASRLDLLIEATPWFARDEARYRFDERAAILEVLGKHPRARAEDMAFQEVKSIQWT